MNEKLLALHTLCLKNKDQDFKHRLQQLAEFFLGCGYGAWANGASMETLDDCKYDLNTLDCVTYVEVVLSLAKIPPHTDFNEFVAEFEHMLRRIHYANGQSSFLARNHFMCVDWIENNKYLVEDMTATLSNTAKVAETVIDKLNWFKKHKINQNLNGEFPAHIALQLPSVKSRVSYIENTEILSDYPSFVHKFPEYCIVNVVRPNWDIAERIGTRLNISHLGLAIKDALAQQIKLFHATSEKLKVVQETLDVYVRRQQSSPTVRGINVLAISPDFYHAR